MGVSEPGKVMVSVGTVSGTVTLVGSGASSDPELSGVAVGVGGISLVAEGMVVSEPPKVMVSVETESGSVTPVGSGASSDPEVSGVGVDIREIQLVVEAMGVSGPGKVMVSLVDDRAMVALSGGQPRTSHTGVENSTPVVNVPVGMLGDSTEDSILETIDGAGVDVLVKGMNEVLDAGAVGVSLGRAVVTRVGVTETEFS